MFIYYVFVILTTCIIQCLSFYPFTRFSSYYGSLCSEQLREGEFLFENWLKIKKILQVDARLGMIERIQGLPQRSLISYQSLEIGKDIISLPLQLCIQSRVGEGVNRESAALSLLEECHNSDSIFKSYLESLPKPISFRTPLHWKDDELFAIPYESLSKYKP